MQWFGQELATSPDPAEIPVPDPYQVLAAHEDITLLHRPLPPGEMGRWYPEQRVIVLSPTLTQAEARCTLMHELLHAVRDEAGVDHGWLSRRQEKHCHTLVARILIPLHRLRDELPRCSDESELAEALNVDVDTLLHRFDSLTAQERDHLASRNLLEAIA